MYLYNSATHKKAEFTTHTPGHVEMYTCGPTVYHFAHIGNLRSYIMEDVLEKFLRYTGRSFSALAVETGSAKMGTPACSASQAMESAGMLVSTTMIWLLQSSFCRWASIWGVRWR